MKTHYKNSNPLLLILGLAVLCGINCSYAYDEVSVPQVATRPFFNPNTFIKSSTPPAQQSPNSETQKLLEVTQQGFQELQNAPLPRSGGNSGCNPN